MCLTRAQCVNPLITTIHTSTAVTAAEATRSGVLEAVGERFSVLVQVWLVSRVYKSCHVLARSPLKKSFLISVGLPWLNKG